MRVQIKGSYALLMHSDRTVDVIMDPEVRKLHQLAKKRNKTVEDHEMLCWMEFKLALYHDEALGPYIPGANIRACLVAGGKFGRLGSAIKRSLVMREDRLALEYEGPREPAQLWADRFDSHYVDYRSVVIGGKRCMRVRPKFAEWRLRFTMDFDDRAIDRDQIETALRTAGNLIGLGDFRPEKGGPFGRFEVVSVQ